MLIIISSISLFITTLILILTGAYFRLTSGKCRSTRRLDGKTVLITGGTAGIGFEYLLDICRRGASIIIACRNVTKARRAREAIIKQTGNENITVVECDLSSLKSVEKCCQKIRESFCKIDVFCCFAAAVGDSVADRPTEDGWETQFQCNYLSHFLMIVLLFDCFRQSSDCRLILTSSAAHMLGQLEPINKYGVFPTARTPFQLYGDSKLALIMLARYLNDRLNDAKYDNITVNAFHPGTVHTDGIKGTRSTVLKYFLVFLSWIYGKTPEDGAQTMLHLTVAEQQQHRHSTSGLFWADCQSVRIGNKQAYDDELCRRLFCRSLSILEPFLQSPSSSAPLDSVFVFSSDSSSSLKH